MKRYNVVFNRSYQPELMVEEKDGDYVEYEDAAATIGELLEALEDLLPAVEAASESLGRFCSDEGWDTPDMDRMDALDGTLCLLRAAIAKAKGEQP